MMDEDFNEVGEEAANVPQYWPPDQAMRLECLRLAVGGITTPAEENAAKAQKYYDFIQGMVELKPAAN